MQVFKTESCPLISAFSNNTALEKFCSRLNLSKLGNGLWVETEDLVQARYTFQIVSGFQYSRPIDKQITLDRDGIRLGTRRKV